MSLRGGYLEIRVHPAGLIHQRQERLGDLTMSFNLYIDFIPRKRPQQPGQAAQFNLMEYVVRVRIE